MLISIPILPKEGEQDNNMELVILPLLEVDWAEFNSENSFLLRLVIMQVTLRRRQFHTIITSYSATQAMCNFPVHVHMLMN
jgi:hypothetical protein